MRVPLMIRIGALVAVAAHGRGDGVDRRRTVAVDAAGDVAQAVGRGSPRQAVAGLFPSGYPATVYGTPRLKPARSVYASFQDCEEESNTHFCNPAVV